MQKIAILYDASQAVLSTFDLDEVLRQILSIIRDYFGVSHSAVLLLDKNSNELVQRCRSGWPDDIEMQSLPVGRGIVGTAAQVKRPVYVPDVHRDPRYIETIQCTVCELAIPLMVSEQVVGVLDCQSPQAGCFDPDSIDLLTLFSTQASIAIRNAQLHELERRRAAQLEVINQIARQTTAVNDIDELLKRFCGLLRNTFPVDHVAVLLLDENRLVLRAHEGTLGLRLMIGADIPAGSGLCGRALSLGVPVFARDVTAEPDYVPGLAGTRSELCLPLITFGQPLGVVSLSSARLDGLQESDVQVLESVADICAAAVQNAIYFDRVRQLAYRDGLTGIFNRRYFEMRIVEELERARRYNLVLSALLIDLDGFKALNDEFGHLLGDEALRQISAILTQQVRKADIVCRYGGDEFAVLLPETNGQRAMAAADKLRQMVAGWEFPGVPRPISISIGVACFPEHGTSRDELVKAADEALYAAKEAGRNRIMLATPGRSARA